MARHHDTLRLDRTEEALTVLFCLVDDAYALLNPRARRYESLKRLSDSEVITLALFQQLRGIESQRSFLRDVQRFFSRLFPGATGLHPSSLHRRTRKLRRFLEPLRRDVVAELVGDPETLVVDSTLLSAASLAPQAGEAVRGLGGALVRRGVGEVGLLLGVRGEAAPLMRHQPGARLLRVDRRQRRRGAPGR